ncbi:WecB/TagA/CpsF family glycosyltransferase [Hyphomicrobium facile]|uniref:Beta-1,4-glucosyltransferase n=1 Tax=Hyphomicrobium facile TaxID=51670 RepID=A0A1I7N638_9HYPH|nr:WecB/TagA/CpsF family glycosyltransferase [Hyphomicrobium facile]SFV30125.1 beta-1,4-glucosyltransferase [Hyphomicrobium facile]
MSQSCLPRLPSRKIFGVDVATLSKSEALDVIVDGLRTSRSINVAFANANLLLKARRDPLLQRQLGGMLVLNDGVGVDIASRILYGKGFPENLNGTDLTPELLKRLPKRTPVFLYGSRPAVVCRAAEILRQKYQSEICGVCDGYCDNPDVAVDAIKRAHAKVVLVALGNPKQEQWMSEKVSACGVLALGVGGYLDVETGRVKRPPRWLRTAKCEWLFRITQEPSRLWRRYTIEVIWFLAAVALDRIAVSSPWGRLRREL